jgi:cytochrome c553
MISQRSLLAITVAFVSTASWAGNPEAGKSTVETVCAGCHGSTGISAAGTFPNLAGQKEDYLRNALTAYREGTRKAPIMNNMAAGMTDQQIGDIAAYLTSLKRCE